MTVRWSNYQTVVVLLSTQLNALARDAASAAGAALDFGAVAMFADVEFYTASTFSPTVGGRVEVWFLRSIDGGVTYEDGGGAVIPGRPPDLKIPVRGASTVRVRATGSGLMLPPGKYKPMLRNRTGVALPATGNVLRMAAYSEAVN